jgi:hypothetical protein
MYLCRWGNSDRGRASRHGFPGTAWEPETRNSEPTVGVKHLGDYLCFPMNNFISKCFTQPPRQVIAIEAEPLDMGSQAQPGNQKPENSEPTVGVKHLGDYLCFPMNNFISKCFTQPPRQVKYTQPPRQVKYNRQITEITPESVIFQQRNSFISTYFIAIIE